MSVLEIKDVTVKYGKFVAVDAASFVAESGEITGIIGANGGGKSSFIQAVAGILNFNGKITFEGCSYTGPEESAKVKDKIGLMPQGIGIILYNSLSVYQQVDFLARIKKVKIDKDYKKAKDDLLEVAELLQFKDRLVGNLSGGMKQKLALVCTLINKPRILLLDEPTIGIDPISRMEFWQLLINITHQEDIISIISTTYIQEAHYMDKLILVEEGKIVDCGTKERLFSSIEEFCYEPTGLEFQNVIKTDKYTYSTNSLPLKRKAPGVESVFFVNWLKKDKTYPVFPIKEIKHAGLPESIINVTGVTKKFGNFRALTDVSLTLRKNEILGLLGPNGAGKTTFMKVLLGLIPSDEGDMELLGTKIKGYKDRIKLKSKIGYLSQNFALYKRMSVKENLLYFGSLHGLKSKDLDKKIKDYALMLDFGKWINHLAENISFGLRQRLSLAAALLHEPYILVLDEPTNGVDVVAREFFWGILHKIKQNWDISIIISTHYMGEAEYCDRIVLLKDGIKIADDNVENLYRAVPGAQDFEEVFVGIYKKYA